LPRNKRVYRLSAAFIEQAHDVGINLVWPGIEPVKQSSCLNINLLMSAAEQPYQECFGFELYPSLAAKAAYLFCHLALDTFLAMEISEPPPSASIFFWQ
jgi:hypothetical protein